MIAVSSNPLTLCFLDDLRDLPRGQWEVRGLVLSGPEAHGHPGRGQGLPLPQLHSEMEGLQENTAAH